MNLDGIVIPPTSQLYASFQNMATHQRMVFFAGIPGVGKSLLLQQLALMAHQSGRLIHRLQWDVTRSAFETDALLARYPEIDGVTHAAIRKAVGLWARDGVRAWHQEHPDARHMLIGEVPLIGNRLIELVQQRDDEAEALLSDERALFVIPVPSREVRAVIEAAREKSITQPQHEKEAKDAPPNVLHALWQELYQLAAHLGMSPPQAEQPIPYDPAIYDGVYRHLLQHRHVESLFIDTVLRPSQSVYALNMAIEEVMATPSDVERIMSHIEQTYITATLEAAVDQWYKV